MANAKQPKVVVAAFRRRADAERAVEALHQAGFRDAQIGLAARDRSKAARARANDETYAEEGAVAGAVAGAGVGALVGLGIMAGVIPVIGPVIAGGTLAAILANAAGGAAIGGLAGALAGWGIPEEEAEFYERELKAGRTVVTVRAPSRLDEARAILRQHGGYELHDTAAGAAKGSERRATGEQTLELKEEELRARKTPVKTGEVKVRKDVVTEKKTLEVPVRREEVVVERRPASGRRATSADLEAKEIRIPVTEEEVHVEKQPVVREEVHVGKRTVQDTRKVSGTVRREEARVEQEGKGEVCDTRNPRTR